MNIPYEKCFYVRGSRSIIDCAAIYPEDHPHRVDNQYRSHVEAECLDEIRKRYPTAELRDFAEVCREIEALDRAHDCHPPKEITKERFWEKLEVLPPVDWQRRGSHESFKIMERLCGNLTTICVRVGDRYFELVEDIRTPHEKLLELVGAKNGILNFPTTTGQP